jgi:cytochrome c-type biogenesis protein CcmH/NrfF
MYFELFIAAGLLCLGEIVFGRFEEGTSKGRRIRKMIVFFGVTALLSHYAGRTAALVWIFTAMALGLGVHAWWTRKHGIRFFDPEPWDRYRALRGWAR